MAGTNGSLRQRGSAAELQHLGGAASSGDEDDYEDHALLAGTAGPLSDSAAHAEPPHTGALASFRVSGLLSEEDVASPRSAADGSPGDEKKQLLQPGLGPGSRKRSGSGQELSRHSGMSDSGSEAGEEELFQAMELELQARPQPEDDSEPATAIGRFFKWVLSFAVPGMGMFTEAYFVFSVGNLTGVFEKEYPDCWVSHTECSKTLLQSIHYTQVGGIILGQLVLGFAADRIGRKWGSVITSATMLIGGVLLACSNGQNAQGIFLMYTLSQAVLGVGIGGEYPIASSSASERAEADKKLANKRGETVMLTFSMQGWGNWWNTLIVLLLLVIFGQFGPAYSPAELETVWRLSFILGLVPIAGMLCYRLVVLQESATWKAQRQKLKQEGVGSGFDWWKASCWARYYWHRLLGTAASWFVWDFAFYGNKLFQSTFISIINPTATLMQVLGWTLLNSSVALVGYYFAAFTVDKAWMGRRRMQIMGFAWMFVLFIICAAQYNKLILPRYIHVFQFLYYFSSFWGQWGPNATTWLLPSELFPTETRAMSHGLAAATGKMGAVVAGVVFGLVGTRAKFYISAFCGLVGVVVTYILIPDISTLDLQEGDRRWLALLEGRATDYHGEAVNPKNLSVFEMAMGYGRRYRRTSDSTSELQKAMAASAQTTVV